MIKRLGVLSPISVKAHGRVESLQKEKCQVTPVVPELRRFDQKIWMMMISCAGYRIRVPPSDSEKTPYFQ